MHTDVRLAAVDIGTNSVLLLVVERQRDGGLERLHEECVITRLGQGVDRSGRLAPEAVERTLAALGSFAATMEQLSVTRRAAVGTAVLRDADEDNAARRSMEAALGCPVEVISGRREAELVLAGVQGSLGSLQPGTVVFDVGGGSTELVLCADAGAAELLSLELGSVRMTERFLDADSPAAGELTALRRAVGRELAALPDPPWAETGAELVGIAGTVTTLATMHLALAEYDTDRVNGLWLTREQIEDRLGALAALARREREQVVGLSPGRADIIVAGVCIVAEVMARFGAHRLHVCDRGVRWGLLWELAAGPDQIS